MLKSIWFRAALVSLAIGAGGWWVWPQPLPLANPHGPGYVPLKHLIPPDMQPAHDSAIPASRNARVLVVDALKHKAPPAVWDFEKLNRVLNYRNGVPAPLRRELLTRLDKDLPIRNKIRRVLKKYSFQWSKPPDPLHSGNDSTVIRRYAEELAQRARLHAEDAAFDDALDKLELVLLIGHAAAAPGATHEQFSGEICTLYALSSIRSVIGSHNITATDIQKILTLLDEPRWYDARRESIKVELCFAIDELERMTNRGALEWITLSDALPRTVRFRHHRPLDKIATARLVIAIYRELADNVGVPATRAFYKALNDAKASLPTVNRVPSLPVLADAARKYQIPHPLERPAALDAFWNDVRDIENPLGPLVAEAVFEMNRDSFRHRYTVDVAYQATRVACALKIYKLRQGHYPPDLDRLVAAGILSHVPDDPASGKPFVYDTKALKLWSVGKNGRDDGGVVGDTTFRYSNGLDIVFDLP